MENISEPKVTESQSVVNYEVDHELPESTITASLYSGSTKRKHPRHLKSPVIPKSDSFNELNESIFNESLYSPSEEISPLNTISFSTQSLNLITPPPLQSVIVYKRRWLTLFTFSMNTMMNGLLFMSLAPINNIAVEYYGVRADNVEWLSNMFMLVYIMLALPSSYLMSRWGIRPLIMCASAFDFLATIFHYVGHPQDKFWLVIFGQTFAAIAYCMIIQIPGKLSSLWFPEKEGSTATSIGAFMNLFGVGLGFLQPSLMVKESKDMNEIEDGLKMFYLSQMILSGLILGLTSTYKEKPPTPPCYNTSREQMSFSRSLKKLWANKQFMILSQSYGIYFGLFVTFSVLVNPLVTSKFTEGYDESLGWMGFWSDMAAILSSLLIGVILDKCHAHHVTGIVLNFVSMLLWLIFVIVLTNTEQFTLLYILYVLLGIFGVPYFASGMEQAAEMTYPVSEETSSTVILILGNSYGFVFIFTLGLAAEEGYIRLVGYTMVALYFISTILATFAKTELLRLKAEKEASSRYTASSGPPSVMSKVDSWI